MEKIKTPEEILDAIIGEISAENKDKVWYYDAIADMHEYGKQRHNEAIKAAAENATAYSVSVGCAIVDKDSILKLLEP